jgi:lipase chaperone LimK
MAIKLTRARVGLGLLAGALVGAAVVLWPQATPELKSDAPSLAKGGTFANSMEGTVPDGDLAAVHANRSAGPSGGLAYAELRRMFDYYLSAVGEQSIEDITQQIRSELDRTMPPAQASAAKRLLALYLAFKRELVDLEKKPDLAGTGVQAIRKRFLAMQDLRARFFSEQETQGMFGFDDAYDMDAIARLEIDQTPGLNDAQKKAKYAALDAAMPAALREEREAPRVVIRLEEMAQAMRAKGASEDDIYRMRTKELNPEAAARLAEVDREELAWKARITDYLNERNRLLKNHTDWSESERQTALSQLQQSRFDENERRRLPAYEK